MKMGTCSITFAPSPRCSRAFVFGGIGGLPCLYSGSAATLSKWSALNFCLNVEYFFIDVARLIQASACSALLAPAGALAPPRLLRRG